VFGGYVHLVLACHIIVLQEISPNPFFWFGADARFFKSFAQGLASLFFNLRGRSDFGRVVFFTAIFTFFFIGFIVLGFWNCGYHVRRHPQSIAGSRALICVVKKLLSWPIHFFSVLNQI
jgi:hypothetical protein